MTITAAPSLVYFRSAPLLQPPQRVDREKRIIYGAAIMQIGKTRDSRPYFADETSLSQVQEFGSRPNKGLKARFTHPNMSDDGMGKFLGSWRNFRRDTDFVRADLHLSPKAFTSPHGDLGTYILDMAEDHPEEFGVSIAPLGLDSNAMEREARPDGLQPIRITGLKAADIVDDPAATHGGFFSSSNNASDIPAMATRFLDHHFAGATPDAIRARVDGFLTKYFATKGVSIMADARATLTAPAPTITAPAPAIPAATTAPTVEQFNSVMGELRSLKEQLASVPALLQDAQVKEAARISEIDALFANMGLSAADLDDFKSKNPKATVEQASLFSCQAHIKSKGGNMSVAGGSNDQPDTKDPDAKFKAEYAAEAAYFKSRGSSEEDYVHMRRVQEGLEPLQKPKPKAKD